MIDQPFLMSVLSSLVLGFKSNSFLRQQDINREFKEDINLQISSMVNRGASQFPIQINIVGPVIKYSDWYYTGTQTILNILKQVEMDDRISGVLFNIDSGGGMGDGTRELANFIHNMETPSVGYSNGLVCSAAEYIFAACNYRTLNPDASYIGSIGTYFPFANYQGIFEKLGAEFKDIYAEDSSLKNLYYREMVENKNDAIFKEMAANFNNEFVSDIKKFYGTNLKDDGKVFKGHIYRPQEALQIGLVDELCSIEEAILKF